MLLLGLTAAGLVLALGGAWAYRSRALSRGRVAESHLEVAALLLLFLATLGFFWRIVFSEQVWRPAGGGDLALFLWPTYTFAAETYRMGQLPLWNPCLFGGMPFVGDIQSGIFYPINLLAFGLSNPLTLRDLEFLSILHFWIAGAGMYLLLRMGRLGEGREGDRDPAPPIGHLAALTGAVAFEFSDLFVTHFGNLNLIAAAAWLPLAFLLFRHALLAASRRAALVPAAGASVVLAVSFLAGHIQAFFFLVLALVVYALFEGVRAWSSGEGWRAVAWPLVLLALTGGLAAALAGPSLLPVLEMAGQTVRQSFTYENAAEFSLPPAQLVGLLVPGFFGRGPAQAWGPWDRVEVGYLGVLPLMLAVFGFALRRDAVTRLFAVLAVVGLALALGGYAILQGWLFQFVPGMSSLRAPARFILLLDFGLAALAAIGFEAVRHRAGGYDNGYKRMTLSVAWVSLTVGVAAAAAALVILILGQDRDPVILTRIANAANAIFFFLLLLFSSTALVRVARRPFRPAWLWGALALALVLFDLLSLGAYVDLGFTDPTLPFRHEDVAAFLGRESAPFRIDSVGTGVEGAWPPDTAILYGLSDLNGDNPLVLAAMNTYWEALGSRASRLYDLLNSKYVLTPPNTPLDAKFRRVFESRGLSVSENGNVLPRAFVVYGARRVLSPAEALSAIHAQGFDPRETVIVEGEAAELPGGMPLMPAVITRYSPNEIELAATAGQPGYLLLSEVFYPGWRAWVDEVEQPVWRADYLFRAVALEAGAHRIRLEYDPLSFRLGLGLAAAGLLALLGLLLFGRQQRRENK